MGVDDEATDVVTVGFRGDETRVDAGLAEEDSEEVATDALRMCPGDSAVLCGTRRDETSGLEGFVEAAF